MIYFSGFLLISENLLFPLQDSAHVYAAHTFELSRVDESFWRSGTNSTCSKGATSPGQTSPCFVSPPGATELVQQGQSIPWVKVVVFMFFLNVQQLLTMLGWHQRYCWFFVPPTGGLGWPKRPRDPAWCITSKVRDPEVPAILKNNVPTR